MSAARPSYDHAHRAARRRARRRSSSTSCSPRTRPGWRLADVFSADLDAAATCGDLRFRGAGRRAAGQPRRSGTGRWPVPARWHRSTRPRCAAAPSRPADGAGPVPARPHRERLPNVPALFLAGDRDLTTPVDSVRAEVRASPNAQLVVINGADHVTTPCRQARAVSAGSCCADHLRLSERQPPGADGDRHRGGRDDNGDVADQRPVTRCIGCGRATVRAPVAPNPRASIAVASGRPGVPRPPAPPAPVPQAARWATETPGRGREPGGPARSAASRPRATAAAAGRPARHRRAGPAPATAARVSAKSIGSVVASTNTPGSAIASSRKDTDAAAARRRS
jgi:hypothetical protein